MNYIVLPMLKGSMDDISQEGETLSSQGEGDSTQPDSLSSRGAKAIYEREAQIRIDYSSVDDDYKDVRGFCISCGFTSVAHQLLFDY